MSYGLTHLIHLLCGISFIGVVFFEVVILEGMRRPLGDARMAEVELALITRAKRIMPWIVGALFVSGVLLATSHVAALSRPLASTFGLMLTAKILLAFSVLAHFVYALRTALDGCMNSRKFRLLHASVATHMVLIVALAKLMFYVP